MSEMLTVMLWPILACLLLPGILVYLGLHIVRRGIIFVDLALAQVAALGTCVAIVLGQHDAAWIIPLQIKLPAFSPHVPNTIGPISISLSYLWSLGFTIGGAG